MPGLSDDMYCSEQICIPPTFPYLLRQYAKAAIRTQPGDLLKWSTAYFRCLSLNIPPPVKPRLEYPIPRDYYGITPGWLKALIFQLQNNLTIPFRVLWDRWIGACLQHNTLIKILCLGGFDNAEAIPWLKFVAICAGLLTDEMESYPDDANIDLSHTMILICEILTEEPEGGSAMISSETFIDLYTFLAKLDASQDQTLRNYYFRDSLLSLWRDKADKEQAAEEVQEEIVSIAPQSIRSKSSTTSAEELIKKEDVEKVVSCPSLPDDDHYSLDYLKEEVGEEELEGEDEPRPEDEMVDEGGEVMVFKTSEMEDNLDGDIGLAESADRFSDRDGAPKEIGADEESEENVEYPGEQDSEIRIEEVDSKVAGDITDETKDDEKQGDAENEVKEYQSVDTISDEPVRDLEHVFDDDVTLKEDLERLKVLQQEMAGETDEELEKFKCKLIAEMPLSQSQEEGIKHFAGTKLQDRSIDGKLKTGEEAKHKASEESTGIPDEEEDKDKRPFDEVYVDRIPGIGGIVPDELIQAVVEYVKKCAKNQHGMFMPRNIRHYSCPPLEVLKY